MSAATYSRSTIKKQVQHTLLNGSTSQAVITIYTAPASPTITKISGYIYMSADLTAAGSYLSGNQWAGAVSSTGNNQSGFTCVDANFYLGTKQFTFPTGSVPQITATFTAGATPDRQTFIHFNEFVVPAGYLFQIQNGATFNNTTTYNTDYYLTVTTETLG